ncbi:M23 family metallopeptidase [Rhabdobacter roseus]|uniref:M23ase beta-sheet core domain-containing protein n=1 Tax=Rhabdobacter roseus TaxID=1655419 RepID=A0A840TJT1_9BACT|nr:M23 family metallopeptidase [Rhabdobacter roseus]MBB5283681.1 hypothetical protein [Rhabdobacter roseus]
MRYIPVCARRIVPALVLILCLVRAEAQKQTFPKGDYPKGYFLFPIRPGLANSLAGVLGDLRTNHYHGGLDIRTQQREGLPVYAAADGYVYKVAVQGTGYGNVIFLRHPNGLTTVYGHLKTFSDSLAAYVRAEQYQKQSFYVDLYPAPGQLTFKKGDVIALSGNTGGSAGPHLHFEIRDSRDNYLNPLYFGFSEIKDQTAPGFVNLALRPMSLESRVNGQFERQVFKPVRQSDGSYRISQPVRATGEVGLELQAYDFMTGTGFRYGLHCIEVTLDGKEVFSFNMEQFPSSITRDYNNLIDYRTEQETGSRFYRCYNPVGNVFDLFHTDEYRGKLQINDTLRHEVRVKIFDSFENSSTLYFTIRGETEVPATSTPETAETNPDWVVAQGEQNVLKVTAQKYLSAEPFATFFTDRRRVQASPAYYHQGAAIFLADLRQYLPDSVQVGNKVQPLHYQARIAAGQAATYQSDRWTIRFDSTSLFDTLYLVLRQNYNALTINDPFTALRHFVQVTYQPEGTFANKARTAVYRYNKGGYNFLGGTWDGDRITFRTRELGTFIVQTDTLPPRIQLLEHSKNRIRAYIRDDMSGIDSFKALVNDEWVLMNYEYKQRYLWSEKRDENAPFEGELTLEVTDKAGNSTILRVPIKDVVAKPPTRKKR